MNERQQKLKQILDRWTACTVDIDQAEAELQEIFVDKTEWILAPHRETREYHPTSGAIKVGNVDIEFSRDDDSRHFKCEIDGNRMRMLTAVDIHLGVHDVPRVKMEFIALKTVLPKQ